jgi:hypothetical protein
MNRSVVAALLAIGLASCSDSPGPPSAATRITAVDGGDQAGPAGSVLQDPLQVLVTDAGDDPVAGVTVTWSVIDGGGSVPPSSVTDNFGRASAQLTLGPALGQQHAQAEVAGLLGSPVVFTATATEEEPQGGGLDVIAGGDNVPDRFSSDLWVHGNYAYTGTWGDRGGDVGNVLNVWSLANVGVPRSSDRSRFLISGRSATCR